jgi:peptide/nickel transport system permease protein
MGKFLLRRAAYLIVLVIIATTIAYLLAATQLNPRSRYEGRNPAPSVTVVDSALDAVNMNDKRPVLERLGHWADGVVHGDLGRTIDNKPVNDEMSRRAWVSLRLLLVGSLIGTALGVAAGAFAAIRQYRVSDHVLAVVSFVLLSIPTVVLAVMIKNSGTGINNAVGHTVLYNTGEYTPGQGGWSPSDLGDRVTHLILPSIVLILQALAYYSRYQRNSMLDVLGSDFLRTAQAKGLRRWRALTKHGLRTALIPLATFFSYQFVLLFVGATFVETQFSWHGMGEYLVQSIQSQDVNATAAVTLFVAVLVLIAGFLSDVAYAALDPRVRVR